MSIGIDIVENKRVKKLLKLHGEQFLKKFLTVKEIGKWKKGGEKIHTLCGIFAAKEAIIKAVGSKINFSHIQITHTKDGAPVATILGKRIKISISISHEISYSVAVAICD